MRAIQALILSLAAQPAAGDISFIFPVDCTLDDDCHLQQFVDHDPSNEASDFTCGSLTYDGHKGTDIALPSLAALDHGINVLAAADGVVRGVRNNMRDVLQGTTSSPDVSDRECGNGVVLEHTDGYETQYCHLARGSVTVRTGDRVPAGQVLGQIGLSGQTEFPHLHLSVRKDGQVIDPFDPDGQITCGAPSSDTLWSEPLATPPGGIITAGFSDHVPSFDAIKAGMPPLPSQAATAPALVLWVNMFGGRAGDQLSIIITGPDGVFLDHSERLDRTQASLFRAAGRRTPAQGWPPGGYVAIATMTRDGQAIDTQTHTITLTR